MFRISIKKKKDILVEKGKWKAIAARYVNQDYTDTEKANQVAQSCDTVARHSGDTKDKL